MGLFDFLKKAAEPDFDHGDDSGMDYRDLSETQEEYGFDRYEDIYDDPDFEDVYDQDGNEVNCDICDGLMGIKDGVYTCRNCHRTMSRSEFLNHIGSEDI